MNKDEAITALANGQVLTHQSFTKNEWIKEKDPQTYQFEDGFVVDKDTFWKYRTSYYWSIGWSIKS